MLIRLVSKKLVKYRINPYILRMRYYVETVEEYIASLPDDRAEAYTKLRKVIKESLPKGFDECFSYGMPVFAVPHSIYPEGYHCKPEEPLPFISLGNQKNFIAFYHLGIYAFPEILDWFKSEYLALNIGKPDMGKSCIRFKKMDKIPYDLIGKLCRKINVEEWIHAYEKELKKE